MVEIKTFEKYYSTTKLFCKDRSNESRHKTDITDRNTFRRKYLCRWDIFGQMEKRKKTGQFGFMREIEPIQRESCMVQVRAQRRANLSRLC